MNNKRWIGVIGLVVLAGLIGGGYTMISMRQQQAAPVEPGTVAVQAGKWLLAAKTEQPVAIDGKWEEKAWEQATPLDGFLTAFEERALLQDVQYRVVYDADKLYIAGRLARTEAENMSQITILLRPETEKETFYTATISLPETEQVKTNAIWNPSPDTVQLSNDLGKRVITDFEHATATEDGVLYVEAAIPLAAVAPAGVAAGDEWRINIAHVHNPYTAPLTSWVPVRQADNWYVGGSDARVRISLIDQDRMGSLFFERMPEALTAGPTMIRWSANELQLRYDSFTTKTVHFARKGETWAADQIKLYWRQPHQTWEPLTVGRMEQQQDTYALTFEHPLTLQDGLYELLLVAERQGNKPQQTVGLLTIDRERLIQAGTAKYMAEREDEERVKRMIDWSEPSADVARIEALIPPQPGFVFVGLPEMPELYPGGLYQLGSDGQTVKATRTGTVYPNDKYPENKALVTTNALGEQVSIPYYENAEGKRFFTTAHVWYFQKQRATSEIQSLARKKPLDAARLLYTFTKAYEGYNPTVDRVGGDLHANMSYSKLAGPPYAYWGGIWNRWWYSDLPGAANLIRAYAELRYTNVFDMLSEKAGEDVEARIRNNLILASANYVLTYPNYLGNMSFQPWAGLIDVAKATGDPDYVHRVVELIERLVNEMFLFDGYWQEVTPSYHIQTINGLKTVANQLKGWTDPPGYLSPRTGKRFDNLDMEQQFPIYKRAVEAGNKLVYPDGKVLPITDTWANNKPAEPVLNGGSLLFPAAKVGRLVGGSGLKQTQVYMGFQPKYGHEHRDPLNMTLYAQGQELLPDLGYTHNSMNRWYALSTMSHNTVVVDSQNMPNNAVARHGGNVETFVADNDLFQVMRADYDAAYPTAETYSREPWLIPYADGTGEDGYVLDLFRVHGGTRHEYVLQGDSNRDAAWETSMKLSDYGPYLLPPGTQVTLPVNNSDSGKAEGHYPGYLYVRDVKQAELSGDQYQVTMTTAMNNTPQASLTVTGLLEPGQNELYLGRSPSLRSIRILGSSKDNNDEAALYTAPKLVLRRDGTNLHSTFVTVLEAHQGEKGRIEQQTRLPLPTDAPAGAVAVQVQYGDTTDIILSNPLHPDQPLVVGDMTLKGEIGFIRIVNGVVKEMRLIKGTSLRKGDRLLEHAGAITGTVVGTKRLAAGDAHDAIVVDASVPAEAVGQYIVIRHPDGSTNGYKIGGVQQEDGHTVVVLAEHDPGFAIAVDGTSHETSYPARTWTGAHTFATATVASKTY